MYRCMFSWGNQEMVPALFLSLRFQLVSEITPMPTILRIFLIVFSNVNSPIFDLVGSTGSTLILSFFFVCRHFFKLAKGNEQRISSWRCRGIHLTPRIETATKESNLQTFLALMKRNGWSTIIKAQQSSVTLQVIPETLI